MSRSKISGIIYDVKDSNNPDRVENPVRVFGSHNPPFVKGTCTETTDYTDFKEKVIALNSTTFHKNLYKNECHCEEWNDEANPCSIKPYDCFAVARNNNNIM
ncbi:MAG: hypothetical protein ACUBOA_12900 [Candidatus Loosdrechtia sp.]|uniref:hypothetical protein n=1 Tax=Candidatus Loosdrechtia sp. TaxID=3101272 RepID=UPI003A6F3990|nr:MAG: hypothetical protein QY305_07705 [Candidatus Jettenia sp. AMX2]